MFKSLIYILLLLLFSIVLFDCQKNSESITGFNENDTTNNDSLIIRKPNIYIYPTEKIELNVELKFPKGGKILDSRPLYSNGWRIQVESTGLINDEYRYLFYEARIPEILQREYGWIVEGTELENFFIKNLEELTFSAMEIKDFLDYWLPYFSSQETYVIYPHFTNELAKVIDIKFSLLPDHINRVIYSIEEYAGNITVKSPKLPDYQRKNFTVLEWGVIYR
jgi:hypothetical protein